MNNLTYNGEYNKNGFYKKSQKNKYGRLGERPYLIGNRVLKFNIHRDNYMIIIFLISKKIV